MSCCQCRGRMAGLRRSATKGMDTRKFLTMLSSPLNMSASRTCCNKQQQAQLACIMPIARTSCMSAASSNKLNTTTHAFKLPSLTVWAAVACNGALCWWHYTQQRTLFGRPLTSLTKFLAPSSISSVLMLLQRVRFHAYTSNELCTNVSTGDETSPLCCWPRSDHRTGNTVQCRTAVVAQHCLEVRQQC